MERKQPSEEYSLPEDDRKGPVRTRHESDRDRVRDTHSLETAEGGTCQDTEIQRPSERHSPTDDGRGRGLSGDGETAAEREALTN